MAWDILPTKANIGRFVVSNNPNTWFRPFCKGRLEIVYHIFLDCALAIFLWNASPWPNIIGGFAHRPISDWILALISHVAILGIANSKVRKFQLFASLVLDFIWRARNLLIHKGTVTSPSQAFFQLSRILHIHVTAWRDCSLPSLWVPPDMGWLKANFDVAVKGSFAMAMEMLSDDQGNIFTAATQRLVSTDVL